MAVFEWLFGSEIRVRAEKLWSVSQHSQEEFADGELGRMFSKGSIFVTSRDTLLRILIAIGVAIRYLDCHARGSRTVRRKIDYRLRV